MFEWLSKANLMLQLKKVAADVDKNGGLLNGELADRTCDLMTRMETMNGTAAQGNATIELKKALRAHFQAGGAGISPDALMQIRDRYCELGAEAAKIAQKGGTGLIKVPMSDLVKLHMEGAPIDAIRLEHLNEHLVPAAAEASKNEAYDALRSLVKEHHTTGHVSDANARLINKHLDVMQAHGAVAPTAEEISKTLGNLPYKNRFTGGIEGYAERMEQVAQREMQAVHTTAQVIGGDGAAMKSAWAERVGGASDTVASHVERAGSRGGVATGAAATAAHAEETMAAKATSAVGELVEKGETALKEAGSRIGSWMPDVEKAVEKAAMRVHLP